MYFKGMCFFLLAIVGFVSSQLSAQSLHLLDDTYTDAANADVITNQDIITRKSIVVTNLDTPIGDLGAGERIGFFKHEFETLPSDTTSENITKASIRIWVSDVIQEGTLIVQAVESDWDELTLTANNQPSINPNIIAAVNITQADADHWITIDITEQFQTWANLPESNFGLAVRANPLPNNGSAFVVFSSKEGIYVDTVTTDTDTASVPVVSSATPGLRYKSKNRYAANKHRCKKRSCSKQKCRIKNRCKEKSDCKKCRKKYCKNDRHHDRGRGHHNDNHKECPNDDDEDDDNNNGNTTNTTVLVNTGHPSEIEVVLTNAEFDLLSQGGPLATNVFESGGKRLSSITGISESLDLDSAKHLMFMGTLNLNWSKSGSHTLTCEINISSDSNTYSLPKLTKTLAAESYSDIITLNGVSPEPVVGETSVSVDCEVIDNNGVFVGHSSSGQFTLWAH